MRQFIRDEYWANVKMRCARIMGYPVRAQQKATAALYGAITRNTQAGGQGAGPSHEKDCSHWMGKWKTQAQQGLNRLQGIRDSLKKFIKQQSSRDKGQLNESRNNTRQQNDSLDKASHPSMPSVQKTECQVKSLPKQLYRSRELTRVCSDKLTRP